jgi:hypothetical protein
MSWDWDPFRHMELGRTADYKVVIYCHNCGMERNLDRGDDITLHEVWTAWERHVRESHKMTPEDTTTYSAPGKRFVPGPPLDTYVIKLDDNRTEVWGHYA